MSMIAVSTALLLVSAGASAQPGHDGHPGTHRDGQLARDFSAVTRDTVWSLADRLHLDFETFHTEGLAITRHHLFLSAVEILEPTHPYPVPVHGYDRTPGKGIGHLFVMDRQGHLQKDIVLGEGHRYHPGGIAFDGTDVWVPVAEYRPDSSAVLYRVDASTLRVTREFKVRDHIGGVVLDGSTGHLVGNTWGSRRFYEWDRHGHRLATWQNTGYFVDYQDCQYVRTAKMLCGGVTNLPQTPAAGGAASVYELGGMALIDLRTHRTLREVPFQKWSTAGHVMTRNPLKLAATGDCLDLWAAPDNGDEGVGTVVFHYRADVAP
jgi:hypothetical protein